MAGKEVASRTLNRKQYKNERIEERARLQQSKSLETKWAQYVIESLTFHNGDVQHQATLKSLPKKSQTVASGILLRFMEENIRFLDLVWRSNVRTDESHDYTY